MTFDYTQSDNVWFCPFPRCLSSFGIMITGHRKETESQEKGGGSSQPPVTPAQKMALPEGAYTSFCPVSACLFPSSCEMFSVLWQINHSSKNQPAITSSCLQIKLKFEGTYLLKIITTCLEGGGQSLKRDHETYLQSLFMARKATEDGLVKESWAEQPSQLSSPGAFPTPRQLYHQETPQRPCLGVNVQFHLSIIGEYLFLFTAKCAYALTVCNNLGILFRQEFPIKKLSLRAFTDATIIYIFPSLLFFLFLKQN